MKIYQTKEELLQAGLLPPVDLPAPDAVDEFRDHLWPRTNLIIRREPWMRPLRRTEVCERLENGIPKPVITFKSPIASSQETSVQKKIETVFGFAGYPQIDLSESPFLHLITTPFNLADATSAGCLEDALDHYNKEYTKAMLGLS